MDIRTLKKERLLLLDCISGSRAYGLSTTTSDTDKRGVFYLPKLRFYGFSSIDQISNDSNDESYTELGRFFELLAKSNPTMIELLHTSKESVLTKHPLFNSIKKEWYLTKECKNTFAGYAITQIRKAKGLNKKVLNPMEKERKSVLDFCYVPLHQGSVSLNKFLVIKGWDQSDCGLSKIPRLNEVYALYHSKTKQYKGIIQKAEANEVSLSSVESDVEPEALLSFNQSGYSTYCKEYKEYWDWVDRRNEARYENTIGHGKNYDSKNMMHTFRLLTMADEIAREGEVFVKRSDRDFLLKIRSGEFEYNHLLEMAEEKISSMEKAYESSQLPERTNKEELEDALVNFRKEIYK